MLNKALDHLGALELDVRIQIPLLNPRAQRLHDLIDDICVRLQRVSAIELSVPRQIASDRLGERLAPPQLSMIRPLLKGILDETSEQGIPVQIIPSSGIPFCGIPEEYRNPEIAPFHPTRPARRDNDQGFGAACGDCPMESSCTGVRRWYLDRYGEGDLQPLSEAIQHDRKGSKLEEHFDDAMQRARAQNVMLKVIRPTIVCNQLCPFCSANETSENSFKSVKKTKQKIARWFRLGARHLSFSGGEPTLVKELPDYMRLAKQLGYQKIELVSNGTKTSIPKHAKKLTDAGLDVAFISLHADNEELSAQCTGCENDWVKTVSSLHNFQDLGIQVEINHVVSRFNYQNLPKFVTWFHNEFGSSIHVSFAFVSPLYRAKDNLWLIPRYSEVMPYMKEAMDKLRAWDHPFVVLARAGVPWCQLRGGYQQYSDLTVIANEAHSEDDYKKEKGPNCTDCAIFDLCQGVFLEYGELHGFDELVPLRADEVEVDLKAPINPWYGIIENQAEYKVQWAHENVNWGRNREAWDMAYDAHKSGDSNMIRLRTSEALGFQNSLPSIDGRTDPPRQHTDISMVIEEAIRGHNVDRSEELAFRAGIKPVLYLTPSFDQVQELTDRYQDVHVEVVQSTDGAGLGNGVSTHHAHFFASRTPEDAKAVADVYRAGDPTAQVFQVGKLMGYPECCTAAFAAMADRSNDSENVYAVAKRECDHPHPLLNLGIAHLIPFYPCRMDCPDAIRFAETTLEAIYPGDEGREQRASVMEEMSKPTLYFDKFRSVIFDGSVQGNEVRYRGAQILCRVPNQQVEWDLLNKVWWPYLSRSRKIRFTEETWEFFVGGDKRVAERNTGGPGILLSFPEG